MYVGRDFHEQDPGEQELLTFDFANDLDTEETVVSAVWTCEVMSSSPVADASASSRIIGSASVSGQTTTQKVGTLVAGARYLIKAVATTSLGNTVSLWSHIACREPA